MQLVHVFKSCFIEPPLHNTCMIHNYFCTMQTAGRRYLFSHRVCPNQYDQYCRGNHHHYDRLDLGNDDEAL